VIVKQLAHFKHWDVAALLCAMLILTVLEFIGVFRKDCVTITFVTKTYVPKWALAAIWGWLGWHFLMADAVQKAIGGK
jgi:hypothetical protein